MSRGKQYSDLLVAQNVDGAAIATSTVKTRLQAAPARLILPGGYFDQVGKTLEIDMVGRIGTVVTTPGTFTITCNLGGTVTTGTGASTGGVDVFTSGAITPVTAGVTNRTWWLHLLLTAQVLGDGALAKLMGVATFTSDVLLGATAGQPLDVFLPASSPVQGAGFDATASQSLDMTFTWSVSNAANTVQSHLYTVKALN